MGSRERRKVDTHSSNDAETTIPISTAHNFSQNICLAHVSRRTAATLPTANASHFAAFGRILRTCFESTRSTSSAGKTPFPESAHHILDLECSRRQRVSLWIKPRGDWTARLRPYTELQRAADGEQADECTKYW